MTVVEVFKVETTSPDISNLVLILLSLDALRNKLNKTKENKKRQIIGFTRKCHSYFIRIF